MGKWQEKNENESSQLMEQISNEILSKLNLDPLENIQIILEGTHQILGGSFTLYNRFIDQASRVISYTSTQDKKLKNSMMRVKGFCEILAKHGKDTILNIPDFSQSTLIQSIPVTDIAPNIKAYLGVPVKIGHQIMGILAITDSKARIFTKTEIGLLLNLARFIALEESRQHALNEKKELSTKYKTIFDNLNAGIALLKGNQMVDANAALCNLLGYHKEELLGQGIPGFSPKFQQDGNLSTKKIKLYLNESKKKTQKISWTLKSKNGKLVYTEISLSHLNKLDQADTLAFIYDVSKKRKHEKELIRAREKAENADRMKSVFLSNMSHEIRTPLNSIIGFSDLLLDETASREEREMYSEMIGTAGKSLLQLIEDIIDISKIEAGQLRINKSEFEVNRVLKELKLTFEKEKVKRGKENLELKLTRVMAETPIKLYSDELRFRQIFINLLTNAIKFTDEGSIEFGYRAVSPHKIQFFVKDTGSGIDAKDTTLIFERFGQSNQDYVKNKEGKGLGLAITNSLVKLLGGNIWVDSELGMGSTFYFTIPIESDLSSQLELKKIFDSVLEGKTILIADNVEENFHFIRGALQSTRALFIWAKGGIEAVKACSENPEINLVLMDILMPDLDGMSATRLIKKMNPEMPVIAQTAFNNKLEHEKIMSSGFDAFLEKPIDFKELYQLLTRFLLT
jgi:PAS domain S-box-containing protein